MTILPRGHGIDCDRKKTINEVVISAFFIGNSGNVLKNKRLVSVFEVGDFPHKTERFKSKELFLLKGMNEKH